jgi:2-iminobutanoate/2-iminopropanoate deaminase
MRELVTSRHMSAPRFRYTPCVLSGPFAFVSGMVALDPSTGALLKGGVGEQTQRIFDNLHLVLLDYGVTLEQLCMARIYTTCFECFEEINRVWDAQFTFVAPPARTSVGVDALPLGALIEIEFCFHKS